MPICCVLLIAVKADTRQQTFWITAELRDSKNADFIVFLQTFVCVSYADEYIINWKICYTCCYCSARSRQNLITFGQIFAILAVVSLEKYRVVPEEFQFAWYGVFSCTNLFHQSLLRSQNYRVYIVHTDLQVYSTTRSRAF